MSTPEPEWELPAPPPPPGIDLEAGELLLIDWVLCGASHILPVHELEELVPRWHDLRLEVWRGLHVLAAGPKAPKQTHYLLSESEAEKLLALVPTTHRWGTGPDCGYTLKLKIAGFLGVNPLPEVAKPEAKLPDYVDD